jgi:hypothetical protein
MSFDRTDTEVEKEAPDSRLRQVVDDYAAYRPDLSGGERTIRTMGSKGKRFDFGTIRGMKLAEDVKPAPKKRTFKDPYTPEQSKKVSGSTRAAINPLFDILKSGKQIKKNPALVHPASAIEWMTSRKIDPEKYEYEALDLDDDETTPKDLIIYNKKTGAPYSVGGYQLRSRKGQAEKEQEYYKYLEENPTSKARRQAPFAKLVSMKKNEEEDYSLQGRFRQIMSCFVRRMLCFLLKQTANDAANPDSNVQQLDRLLKPNCIMVLKERE